MQRDTVVTGGASGLGRVVAESLLDHGHRVVLVDRDQQQLQTTTAELVERGAPSCEMVVADLSTVGGIDAAAQQLLEQVRVGALVNNAGGWLPGDQYPDADPDRWLSSITLNLLAPMRLTARLWPALAAVAGTVVNIGSSGGEGDDAYASPEYAASKAGVRRFTASLSARSDVRVMAVVPGWIGLDRAQQQWDALTPDEQDAAGLLIPPHEVAGAVVDLLEHGRPGQVVEMLRPTDPV